mmetsp:Transcript_118574/g.332031  ORF Transcript_118574/g.332031 Transcript_118574/m.332031 type:complete len:424 (+) Transcript_118574:91-1362(+)
MATNPEGNYGFLSRFDVTPEEIERQVDYMVDVLKICDVQFYDWFANYGGQYQAWDSDPKNAFNRAPQPRWWEKESWNDPYFGTTVIRKDTLQAAVRRVQARGARAWAYVQAVGAEHWTLEDASNQAEKRSSCRPPSGAVAGAAFPPVVEYCDGSDGSPADPGFFRLRTLDTNEWYVQRSDWPTARQFPCYLMNKTLAKFQLNAWFGLVFEVFGFSGIHWDTLGNIGEVNAERFGAEEFLHEVRAVLDKQHGRRNHPGKDAASSRAVARLMQTFNNIDIKWWDDASTPQLFTNCVLEFPYTEVWSPEAEECFYERMRKVRAAGLLKIRPVIANYPEGDNGIKTLDSTWTAEKLVQVRATAAFDQGARYWGAVLGRGQRPAQADHRVFPRHCGVDRRQRAGHRGLRAAIRTGGRARGEGGLAEAR